jgi:holliday junction DNA helicase RuvA
LIGRLRGTLAERRDTVVIVDCGGVGYEVTVSAYTGSSLPAVGEPVTLRVFTHALENKIALYGFGSAHERKLFDLLITVKNVGPSSAMGILSGGAGPAEIARMIAAGEVAGITKIKGVGTKTAELLVVELREKCELLLATWGAAGELGGMRVVAPAPTPVRPPILDDVASALVGLGWRQTEADKAVADLEVGAEAELEVLLRQALRGMPR